MSSVGFQRAGDVVPLESLRSIAHELRQPLSGIESAAYYLTLVLPRGDEKIQKQLAKIRLLVEQADWILGNGLQLADLAPMVPETVDLEELLLQAVADIDVAGQKLMRLELRGDLPLVRVDPARSRALVENLLLLVRQVATPVHPVVMATSLRDEGGVCLELSTTVPGLNAMAGLGPGAALSLESARLIAEAHGGALEYSADPVHGIRLRVMLP